VTAWPSRHLVGTDSHTPHVDALGVIAIGVGGLEAET
jgi:aconitate hydratase